MQRKKRDVKTANSDKQKLNLTISSMYIVKKKKKVVQIYIQMGGGGGQRQRRMCFLGGTGAFQGRMWSDALTGCSLLPGWKRWEALATQEDGKDEYVSVCV